MRRHPAAGPAATEGLHLAGCRKRVERPLHGARADAKRQRQRRTRPRLAVGEQGQHLGMSALRTGGASTTTVRAARRLSAKPRVRRAHVRQRPQCPREAARSSTRSRARCDSSACFARKARAISVLARHVVGPGLGQRAGEREQDRARRKRNDHRACVAHDITAGVHHKRVRCRAAPRHRRAAEGRSSPRAIRRAAGVVEREGCAFNLGRQRGDPCLARGVLCAIERGARRLRTERRIAMPATTSSWPARDAGGKGAGSSAASARSASSRRPISSKPPDLEIAAHVRRSTRSPCASSVARAASSAFGGPAQIARDERDLGLGDDAPCAGHGLLRTEGARRTAQQSPSPDRDRQAAPSRCRAARAPADRRAARPASARRADRPPRARAPRP